MNCYANTDFHVSLLSEQLVSSTELGTVQVEGLVEVSLVARRAGNQVLIYAKDRSNKVIGKAETVVGLKQTPIYILTTEGLKKITIQWGTQPH
jgi:hypothetical protein